MKKKPIVLLDCDGVLTDFTEAALELIKQETGRSYTAAEIPRWDIFESLGYPELWTLFTKKASEIGYCRDLKVCDRALDGVQNLREKYDVVVVTAPVDALPWMYERAHWLEDNFDISRKKVIFAHEKQHVCGDVLVDDKPDNVIQWFEAHPQGLAVLWSHPYNQNVSLPSGIVRTSDWNELISLLDKRFG